MTEKHADSSNSSTSDLDASSADEEEFMKQWRAQRIQELKSMSMRQTKRVSPSRRAWGRVDEVDATGYLDAVEKVANDVIVVVLIYDPGVRDRC